MDIDVFQINQRKYSFELVNKAKLENDLIFNIILLGDSGVGKSSFSLKALKNEFTEQSDENFQISTYYLKINDKFIQIIDTCGQKIYKSLISGYYKNASLAILMYSIDNKESFNNIKSWLKDLKKDAPKGIGIILVGNKADLENERQVSKEEGEKFKTEHNLDLFMETSAKSGINAKNVIIEAAELLYGEIGEEIRQNKENNTSINITEEGGKTRQTKNSKCF